MLDKLIVLVEEPSMEMALEHLLPKMLAGADFHIIRFQCQDDLLKNLPDRPPPGFDGRPTPTRGPCPMTP